MATVNWGKEGVVGAGMPPALRPLLEEIVRRLVHGAYAELVRDGLAPLYTEAGLAQAVRAYPATLAPLGDECWAAGYALPDGKMPGRWSIVLPLQTVEEGRSRFTLECLAWLTTAGTPRIEIDRLHTF